MVEYKEKRALIPIVKTERDIKVEFLKHFYDEISVYVLLRCCHISPDSAYGRRTDRKIAKSVYPVEKVVSVAMKVVAEGVKAWSHRRTDMYRKENGLKYREFGYPVTKFISSAAQSSRDRYVEPGS